MTWYIASLNSCFLYRSLSLWADAFVFYSLPFQIFTSSEYTKDTSFRVVFMSPYVLYKVKEITERKLAAKQHLVFTRKA